MRSHRNKKILVLGIHWAHDAAATLCSPDGIICSIQEERLRRIKHYYGFPQLAIKKIFEFCGISASDISALALSTNSVLFPQHRNFFVIEADGVKKYQDRNHKNGENIIDNFKTHLSDNLGIYELKAYTKIRDLQKKIKLTWGEYAPRHYSFQKKFLQEIGLWDERIPYYYIAHHRCHASSAFRLSGQKEGCVITVDGKGDGLCATIYQATSDGQMKLVRSSLAKDSLGAFYQAATEALGFVPVEGEYKTMGLAALGSGKRNKNPFSPIISVDDGVFHSRISWTYRDFNKVHPKKAVPNILSSVSQSDNYKTLLKKLKREDLAYCAQKHCEENMLQFARDAMKITGSKILLGAGGVMLNVKANALIRDKLKPDHFFVYPDASDSGLAAGAAMEALYQMKALGSAKKWLNPYKGHEFTQKEILHEIKKYKKNFFLTVIPYTHKLMVTKLTEGRVVGIFQGRMEMGPRALGNRSVLADPRNIKVKNKINLILKGREYFVPFAPILQKKDAHLYWKGPTDYYYMTFTVDATSFAKKEVPAVVHVDGTMRPQVVTKKTNPWVYNLLSEFKKRTGIGLLLNTSFNRHGMPVVGSPADVLEHLVNGWVDSVVLGNWYIELKGKKR